MYAEVRSARRFAFVAAAEVHRADVGRSAHVSDLSIAGAYLGMPDPFSKGASVRMKIRTQTEVFQAQFTVVHSTHTLGMGAGANAILRRSSDAVRQTEGIRDHT